MIFNEAARKLFADGKSGNPLPADNRDAAHVVTGDTWDDLVQRLGHRLETAPFEVSAGIRLAPHLGRTLRRTIERFNGDARRGVDRALRPRDFRDRALPQRTTAAGTHRKSDAPSLWGWALPCDHPRSRHARHQGRARPPTHTGGCSRASGRPIEKLYAAGNCAGFPSGRSYWGGGATIAIAITFGRRAALHASIGCNGGMRPP